MVYGLNEEKGTILNMKEIKLNNCPNLRNKVVRAVVDEDQLEFRNGVSTIQATVDAIDFYNRPYSYQCVGLINENFCEAYDNCSATDLMFLPYNKEIIRFNDCDFIVGVNCGEDDRDWIEYRHVKVIDGEVHLMHNHLGECQKVEQPFLTITGKNKKALYDIDQGGFLTPYVENIGISKDNSHTFDVLAQVTCDLYELIDYLYFKINSEGKAVSTVFSCLDNSDSDYYFDLSVDAVLAKRSEELFTKFENFKKVMDQSGFTYRKNR